MSTGRGSMKLLIVYTYEDVHIIFSRMENMIPTLVLELSLGVILFFGFLPTVAN
jgi:hypothetical protein